MDESLVKIRHDRSQKDFPFLKLADDEYIEFAFDRAKVCLLMIIITASTAIIIVLLGFLLTLLAQPMLDEMGKNFVFIILTALLAATLIITIIAISIYHGNKLFITNKRVIQKIMESPVANSMNIIDLSSVEDASFHQNGILPTFFHYGTLRLATVGDETTYTFKYSDISSEDLASVTKLISNAKKPHRRQNKISQVEEKLEDATEESSETPEVNPAAEAAPTVESTE